MKMKMKMKRIDFYGNVKVLDSKLEYLKELNIERIEFYVGKDKFVIKPDFESFRVHKIADDLSGDNTAIVIKPSVSNEILIS